MTTEPTTEIDTQAVENPVENEVPDHAVFRAATEPLEVIDAAVFVASTGDPVEEETSPEVEPFQNITAQDNAGPVVPEVADPVTDPDAVVSPQVVDVDAQWTVEDVPSQEAPPVAEEWKDADNG